MTTSTGARRLVIAAAVILAAAAVLIATLGQRGTTSADRTDQVVGKGPPYPGPASSMPPVTEIARLSSGEQSRVYVEVIRAIAKDSGARAWPAVFVLDARRREDPGGTFTMERGTSIDPRTRTAVRTQLPSVRWIAEPEDAKRDGKECGAVEQDGLIVTLGEIRQDGRLTTVRASGWFGCDGAAWLTYKLDKQSGQWRITGTTGPAVVA